MATFDAMRTKIGGIQVICEISCSFLFSCWAHLCSNSKRQCIIYYSLLNRLIKIGDISVSGYLTNLSLKNWWVFVENGTYIYCCNNRLSCVGRTQQTSKGMRNYISINIKRLHIYFDSSCRPQVEHKSKLTRTES